MSPAAARAAGASGFVSKDREAREVARAVRAVGLGMTMFSPTSEQPAPLLTEREHEVLDLIAAGSTNREIAERLFLSPHTVKEHTSALYRKLRPATGPRRCSGPSGSDSSASPQRLPGQGYPVPMRPRPEGITFSVPGGVAGSWLHARR